MKEEFIIYKEFWREKEVILNTILFGGVVGLFWWFEIGSLVRV